MLKPACVQNLMGVWIEKSDFDRRGDLQCIMYHRRILEVITPSVPHPKSALYSIWAISPELGMSPMAKIVMGYAMHLTRV